MQIVRPGGTLVRLRSHFFLLASALALVSAASAPATAAPAYAVTASGVDLVRFDTDAPATVTPIGTIGGLPAGYTVFDLDIRPRTGLLYALAGNGSAAGLYRVTFSGGQAPQATLVTSFATFPGTTGLIDFDPTDVLNDHIRVFNGSNTGYRVDPDAAPNVLPVALPGVTGGTLVGVAFTNNFRTPSSTQIYGLDVSANRLVTVPDGGGALTAVGTLPVPVDAISGLDITANFNEALALLPTGDGSSRLYRVDLTNGATTDLGVVGSVATGRLHGLAVYARASMVYGVNTNNELVIFLSAVPSLLRNADGSPGAARAITGMAGQQVLALDTRPNDGRLYGLTSAGTIVIIDPVTAAVTTTIPLTGATLTATDFGMFFEPGTPDRIRLLGNDGQNLIVDPDSGAATSLTNTGWSLVAYSEGPPGVRWGIDSAGDNLVTVDANGPSVFIQFPLGLDTSDLASLDVAPADRALFAVFTAPAAATSDFYILRPDAAPGVRVAKIGTQPIGGGRPLRAMAVASMGTVRINPTAYTVNEGPGAANPVPIRIERINGGDGPLTVELRTVNGTAVDGTDFVAARTIFTFLPGAPSTATVTPALVSNDNVSEPDKSFEVEAYAVSLAADTPADPLLPRATVTILDDDARTPTIQITSPTSAPTYAANSLFIALAGVASDPDGQISRVTWSTDQGFSGTASSTAAGSTNWIINVIQLVPGVNTITVTAHDNDNPARTASATLVVTLGDLTYFMAEGAVGFFKLDILVANPTATAANVEVQFLDSDGILPFTQTFMLPGNQRRTLAVNDIPGMEGRQISTIVTSKNAVPLIVERTMEWDKTTRYGSATDHATDGAATRWYFAEGAQGAFNTFLLLVNPHNAPNVAHVRYLRDGESAVQVDYELGPFMRFTADIGNTTDFPAHTGLQQRVFGIEVTFDRPGVAERAMYFGFPPLWRGGHESAGVNQPSRSWFLAEGATGFFQTYILLANPSAQDATIDLDFLLPSGEVVPFHDQPLAAGQRTSIDIAGVDPRLSATAVSTRLSSTVPIIAERAQYWPAGPFEGWQEAHNSFGITEPGLKWGLAEGRVGGPTNYATFILLANPGNQPAHVRIKFLRETGAPFEKDFVVPANGRFTVFGDAPVPELVDENFGALITSDVPIVVERAMYSDALGVTWQAGSNATATRLP